jgi:hypothetical protein
MYSRNRYLDHLTTLFPDTRLGTGCIQLKTLSTDKVFAEQASIMTAYTNTFASSRIDLDAIEFVQLDDSVQVRLWA